MARIPKEEEEEGPDELSRGGYKMPLERIEMSMMPLVILSMVSVSFWAFIVVLYVVYVLPRPPVPVYWPEVLVVGVRHCDGRTQVFSSLSIFIEKA